MDVLAIFTWITAKPANLRLKTDIFTLVPNSWTAIDAMSSFTNLNTILPFTMFSWIRCSRLRFSRIRCYQPLPKKILDEKMSFYLFIAISFYLNIVRKNIVCEMDLNLPLFKLHYRLSKFDLEIVET